MTGTDHPPSTTAPARVARRALITGAAVIATIAAPASIVAAAGGGHLAAASQPDEAGTTSFLDRLDQLRAHSDGEAVFAAVEVLAQAVAPPTTVAPATTTTTVPPATTTTVPPPPPPPPPPPSPPQPVASGGGYNDPNNPAAWDRLAQCEAGGNWAANTGNGYYGGIQFSLGSWQGVGGPGYPHQASRETQIAMGQRLWNQGGWGHWPACSSKLGYR